MRLVVGLGNPGGEFAGTRHNVGWEAVDALAKRLGFSQSPKTNFRGHILDGPVGQERILLLKPLTYMNLSGQSVQAAMAFYQLTPADIMVVLDDLALPSGKLRMRKGGSSGGHNGLKDIERALGTDQYPRLRLGIDAPPSRVPGRDYVLGRFTPEQRKLIDPAVDRSTSAILAWIEQGIEAAMNRFNVDV